MSFGGDEPNTWDEFKRTNSSNLSDSDFASVRCNTPQAIIVIKSSTLQEELTSHVCSPVTDLWLSPGRLSLLPTPVGFLSDGANISHVILNTAQRRSSSRYTFVDSTMNYVRVMSAHVYVSYYRWPLLTPFYFRWDDANRSFCQYQDPDKDYFFLVFESYGQGRRGHFDRVSLWLGNISPWL